MRIATIFTLGKVDVSHLAIEVGGLLRTDTDRFAGLELDAHATAQDHGELLAGVADKIVELTALTGKDAGIGGRHAALGKGTGDGVVVVGPGRITRRLGQ
ncbi:hypothetical protein D3C71_1912260 [compost metagenome]